MPEANKSKEERLFELLLREDAEDVKVVGALIFADDVTFQSLESRIERLRVLLDQARDARQAHQRLSDVWNEIFAPAKPSL